MAHHLKVRDGFNLKTFKYLLLKKSRTFFKNLFLFKYSIKKNVAADLANVLDRSNLRLSYKLLLVASLNNQSV